LGLSQGGLIARYIVEECPTKVPVRNLATLGGPHRGVSSTPNCLEGVFCDLINFIVDNMVYFDMVQEFVGPAGYFRDPDHLERYMADSVFLPYVNNEEDEQASYVTRFDQLNGAMFVMFGDDTVVYPRESEWFGELLSDGTVLPMEQTELYK